MEDLVEDCNLALKLKLKCASENSMVNSLCDDIFDDNSGEGDTPSPQAEKQESPPEVNVQHEQADMPAEQEEEDQEMGEVDHDPTRSEGTIEYRIKNFSKIANKMLSAPVYIRDLPW
jgi:hypothetical protein